MIKNLLITKDGEIKHSGNFRFITIKADVRNVLPENIRAGKHNSETTLNTGGRLNKIN
jgi:hypothetical protein